MTRARADQEKEKENAKKDQREAATCNRPCGVRCPRGGFLVPTNILHPDLSDDVLLRVFDLRVHVHVRIRKEDAAWTWAR